MVADELNSKGILADTVNGEMPVEERDAVFERFASGQIQALTNCEIATTGYDFPGIDLIGLLRPTKSAGLYMQMVGRGLRTALGKDNCMVLDFGGNIERFGAIDSIKVKKVKGKHVLQTMPLKPCPQCGNAVQISLMTCPECGHIFERQMENHEAEASELPILSEERWFNVTETTFKVHRKEGKPPSLKVTYHLEGGDYCNEFICFEHGGFATRKAWQWWKKNIKDFYHLVQTPTETSQAFIVAPHHLKRAKAVLLQRDGKFWRVIGQEYFADGEFYVSPADELGINI